jgi:hypothetical protein
MCGEVEVSARASTPGSARETAQQGLIELESCAVAWASTATGALHRPSHELGHLFSPSGSTPVDRPREACARKSRKELLDISACRANNELDERVSCRRTHSSEECVNGLSPQEDFSKEDS